MTTRNIKLTIAYKGTGYAGWQRQPDAPTVEATLKRAIEGITKEEVTLYGAGRTDAGVHALGQCANFHTKSRVPTERFATAINTQLPKDIRVVEGVEVPEDFHSRYSAKGKAYRYQIDMGKIASPFYADYAWHVDRPLCVAKMAEAAAHFVGTHDFFGFMASGSSVKDTVRCISSLTLEQKEHLLTLRFVGNGFLYNMVRIITGTLYEVGLLRIDGARIPAIIASGERKQAGMTAPPQGLFLEAVFY